MNQLEQKRNGYSLADCAEIQNQMSVLKLDHGEPGYRGPFQQFLRSKGLTESSWATVFNDWYQAMENDPSLGAKYHTYMSQVRQRQMLAIQPNVSGESLEGVSLEAYAKISAQTQTGAAVEGLVAAEGLSMEQWQRGQAAWVQRMGSCSPTDAIVIQFGQLYQKWAPNHQAAMEAATARHLEDAAASQGRGGGMSKELTLDNAPEFFGSARSSSRELAPPPGAHDRSRRVRRFSIGRAPPAGARTPGHAGDVTLQPRRLWNGSGPRPYPAGPCFLSGSRSSTRSGSIAVASSPCGPPRVLSPQVRRASDPPRSPS